MTIEYLFDVHDGRAKAPISTAHRQTQNAAEVGGSKTWLFTSKAESQVYVSRWQPQTRRAHARTSEQL